MDVSTLFDRMESHAAALGAFDRINTHEPVNAPGGGYTTAIWVNRLDPVSSSGLDSTSVRVEFYIRIYTSRQMEPLDAMDPEVLKRTDLLMAQYTNDFDLGGAVRNVDLLGQHGTPLSAAAGHLNLGGILYRVMTITLPLIVNDVWEQEA
jgi:hypothetical protein